MIRLGFHITLFWNRDKVHTVQYYNMQYVILTHNTNHLSCFRYLYRNFPRIFAMETEVRPHTILPNLSMTSRSGRGCNGGCSLIQVSVLIYFYAYSDPNLNTPKIIIDFRANLGLLHDYSSHSLASELPTFETNDQSNTPILMPNPESPRRF